MSAALAGALTDDTVDVELVDLSERTLDFADGRPIAEYSNITRETLDRIRVADAFIFGSPMYRASVTGTLKNLIDLVPDEFLVGKTAGLVATGGSERHYLGIEFGFRSALALLQMYVVPGLVYGAHFDVADGQVADESLSASAAAMGKIVARVARATAGLTTTADGSR